MAYFLGSSCWFQTWIQKFESPNKMGGSSENGRLIHQTFQVPKMEVLTHLYKLYGYGLCKGKPTSKIAENKVQETLHFRYLKFLVICQNYHQLPSRKTLPTEPWATVGPARHHHLLGSDFFFDTKKNCHRFGPPRGTEMDGFDGLDFMGF